MEELISIEQEDRDHHIAILSAIRSEMSDEELRALLDGYHDNDIASVFGELTLSELERLHRALGAEAMSDVISFADDAQLEIGKSEEYYEIIKQLKVVIQKLISQQLSLYMAGKAESEVQKMINERKTFPVFPDDDYGQLRKNDLIRVTKEIYCAEPKIFYKLSDLQE